MDYEEYMRSVLGYNQTPGSIYTNTYDDYYYDMQYLNNQNNMNNEILESMYPEIYKVIYPMISKICAQNCQREITRDLVDNMTEQIYLNMEPDDRPSQISINTKPILKNGDVRNPNAKEPETRNETRQSNFMLRDLIRILIIRELLGRPGRPGFRPPRPQMPPRPPRPPQQWRMY